MSVTARARVLYWTKAYDQHLNMILGEVEETVNYYEIDDETYEETLKVRHTPFPTGNEKKKENNKKTADFVLSQNQINTQNPPQLT